MISEKETGFMRYWERNREIENTFISKLTRGFPMALLFGLPIILTVVVVRLFFPDWYMKISDTTSGTFVVIVVAVAIAVLFFSYFRMHFKWEMNEQLYLELKHMQLQTKEQDDNK